MNNHNPFSRPLSMSKRFNIVLISLLISSTLWSQQTVVGVVSDEFGDPIPGANVQVKDMSRGTITDFDGKYELNNIQVDDTLIFSFVGLLSKEVVVGDQLELNIMLQANVDNLEEVVVVGYGTQKKSDIVGSVAVVNVEAAVTQPTSDISELLRGKAAGVQISQNSNRPGGSSSIIIRGSNSINGGNSPLFVLDGVPTTNIDDISPDEIESIEVLKDAASQAIYGARASNGVILVNTKKGLVGPVKVSYNGYYSVENLYRNFDLYSPSEWVQLRREAYRTDNNDEYLYDDFIFTDLQLNVIQSNNFVNWEDLVIQQGIVTNHNLSLRGGSDQTKLYSNFGVFDQQGLIPGSDFNKLTARVNLDQKINDQMQLKLNTLLTFRKQNRESGNLDWIVLPPVAKAFEDDGSLIRFPLGVNDVNIYNPLWNMRESTNFTESNTLDLNLIFDYQVTDHLKYRVNSSIKRRNANNMQYLTRLHEGGASNNGQASLNDYVTKEYLVENIVTFDKRFNENHYLDATFVFSVNESEYNYTGISASGFENDFLGFNGIEGAENIDQPNRQANKRSRQGMMGRLRYNLKDRYLLTLTSRVDGSSVFSQNNKYGFFPSAALGWKIHQEPFMESISAINQMKFRVSYGSIGNEAINPYQSLGLASPILYAFDGDTSVGYLPGSRLHNPDLTWETSTTFNVGVDFGFFNNILTGSVEVYDTKTTDLLVNRKVNSPGYTTTTYNAGETSNKGYEVLLSADIFRTKNVRWNLSANYASNKNKIISLYGDLDDEGNPIDDVASNLFIGSPIKVIYQYQFDGIWQSTDDIVNSHMPDAAPGDVRVRDISGPDGVPDGILTDDDRVKFKKDPDWFGSITSSLKVNNFELLTDFYIVKGAMKSNPYLADYSSGGTLQGKLNGIRVGYYTPENPSNNYPRPRETTPSYLYALAVQDASFIRLRTLQLSYNLPKKILDEFSLDRLKIFVSGTNVFTITDYKSYNPEVNPGSYPDGREVTIGLKLEL